MNVIFLSVSLKNKFTTFEKQKKCYKTVNYVIICCINRFSCKITFEGYRIFLKII